jgi:TolA-binding protein
MKRTLALALCCLAAGAARADVPSEIPQGIDQITRGVADVENQLVLVEHGYVDLLKTGNLQNLQTRFEKGELSYLLADYVAASVLLYDVVSDPAFRANPHYFDGLYYLGDSLFHQKDYLGSKRFLREVIEAGPGTPRFGESLSRFLDVSARTGDFGDLDRYIHLTEKSAYLAPEVQYLIGKANFERQDLAKFERMKAALAAFARVPAGSAYEPQALYFSGVCHVLLGDLPKARDFFVRVGQIKSPIREEGLLAVGRIDYEMGKYDDALNAYQEIPETSPQFYDALYEVAWTYVRKGDYENARKAVELLMLGAPEGTILPEANLLRGQLLLKLGKYDESAETYSALVSKYGPVRDEIDALLKMHDDPAAYLDRLLKQKGDSYDVTSLLPKPAQRFATVRSDVRGAEQVTADLRESRSGIGDATEIIQRLEEKTMNVDSMRVFPALQAGYVRAGAVDAALLDYDAQTLALQRRLVEPYLEPSELAALNQEQAEIARLQQTFKSLPKTQEQVDQRQAAVAQRLKDLDREIFRLSLSVQSQRAQLVAVRGMAEQTRGQRQSSEADEQRFLENIRAELAKLDAADERLATLRKQIRTEEGTAAGAGEDANAALRQSYAAALAREAAILAAGIPRTPPDIRESCNSLTTLQQRILALRVRTLGSIDSIRQAARTQAALIRQQIAEEAHNLEGYQGEVATNERNAGGLVGRIAYDNFLRVRRHIYDLVLKADVGIIDVGWTRKHDTTAKIQKLAQDEDRELKLLDDDFKEVLGEVH